MAEEFHCEECAGYAKAKGELCSTCDGEGNACKKAEVKVKVAKPKKKKLFSKGD